MKHFIILLVSIQLVLGQNVGIGTPSPSSKLSINGNLSVGANYVGTAAPTNGAIIEGNVGIGTNSPDPYKLSVKGYNAFTDPTGSYNSHFPYTDNNAYISGDNIYLRGGAPTSYNIILTTQASTGNVGINTTSPLAKLHVRDNVIITSGYYRGYNRTIGVNAGVVREVIGSLSGTSSGEPSAGFGLVIGANQASPIVWLYGNPDRNAFQVIKKTWAGDLSTDPALFHVGANGNVGIGTDSPSDLLHVTGNVRFDGTLEPNDNPGNAGDVLTSQGPGSPPVWKSSVPAGAIVMYSGPWSFDASGLGTGDLQGWALCNGNNGTPNLSNRFVMGTTNSGNLNATGGANSYTLTTAQLPAHNHTITAIFHGQGSEGSDNCSGATNYVFFGDDNIWPNCSSPSTKVFSTTTTGSGSAIDNRPAYIQLAFIMKL